MGKGPGRLARLDAGVDPAVGKERFGQFAHPRIKRVVGCHDRGLGLVPVNKSGVFHGQGRVAIPDLHAVQTEPLALEFIIAVAEFGIGGNHRVPQGFYNLGFDLIR